MLVIAEGWGMIGHFISFYISFLLIYLCLNFFYNKRVLIFIGFMIATG